MIVDWDAPEMTFLKYSYYIRFRTLYYRIFKIYRKKIEVNTYKTGAKDDWDFPVKNPDGTDV